jgi:diguanylate cyclase (GGDEF)-like protein
MTDQVIAVDQLIENLKRKNYHLITKRTHTSFQSFVSDMANNLKETVQALTAEIFLLNESTGEFQLFSNNQNSLSYISKQSIKQNEYVSLFDKELSGYPSGESMLTKLLDNVESFLIPLKIEKKSYGFMLLVFQEYTCTSKLLTSFPKLASETLHFVNKMKQFYSSKDEGKKYELLYRVTSKFHSSMAMEDVLEEIIFSLREIFPHFEYFLLLSQDDIRTKNLPVREIDYYNEEYDMSTQAYLTGQMKFGDLSETEFTLYAPLKGKQGIYGVLQVITPKEIHFTDDHIDFISLLANTAGNALENARLYQQSKRLIEDLQLVNKSSQKLNSNMRLSDTYEYMSELIMSSFKAKDVGFVLYHNESQSFRVLDESSSFFATEEGLSFIAFTNNYMKNQANTMFIGDFSHKFPTIPLPYQSVMAVPMIHEQQLIGYVTVLHDEEYFFSFETFKLLQSLVQHSALTVVNSLLKEELEYLVRTDYLTKLYSRKYLDDMMHNHIESGTKGSFILIDIDNFKKINDKYGHEIGDQIILQVAEIIRENIRSHDIAARWGGEELAIYLPNTSIYSCIQVAERLVQRVSESTNPKVTISCGISYWVDNLVDQTQDIFLRADKALYLAKTKGKNQVVNQDELVV